MRRYPPPLPPDDNSAQQAEWNATITTNEATKRPLEVQEGPPTSYTPTTSHIATIEGEHNRTKVMTEIRVSVSPSPVPTTGT